MYRSLYNNGMGNYYDRYSDNTRRSISTSPSYERGNCVLCIYQGLHYRDLLTDEVIIRIFFLLFVNNRNVQGNL